MRECGNSKIHVSSNFLFPICLLIMLDTLLLVPSLHCNTSLHFTTLHQTTLHYTYRHFTSSHLHFITLSFGLTHLHFLSFFEDNLPGTFTSISLYVLFGPASQLDVFVDITGSQIYQQMHLNKPKRGSSLKGASRSVLQMT